MLPEDTVYDVIQTPVGELWLMASRQGLHKLLWKKETPEYQTAIRSMRLEPLHPIIKRAKRQLKEYFSGSRKTFDIPLAPYGTEFQKQVWQELRRIPYGATISYAQQAERLGDKKKARAVGTANSRNPIGIIVPCHRVIAATGGLSGFGGGIEAKKYLLALEAKNH